MEGVLGEGGGEDGKDRATADVCHLGYTDRISVGSVSGRSLTRASNEGSKPFREAG